MQITNFHKLDFLQIDSEMKSEYKIIIGNQHIPKE